jgi:hypothetical protein
MGIGDKLLDNNYTPEEKKQSFSVSEKVKPRCPLPFTDDPIEFMESDQYLGYKLKPLQKPLVLDLFSEDENGNPLYDTVISVQGMRSSKSVCAALIVAFLLHKLLKMDNPGTELHQAPGQKLVAEFIATTELQSKNTAFAAFINIINNTTWFKRYVSWLKDREENEGKGTLYEITQRRVSFLEKNIEILSLHSNASSIAGFTAFALVGDEWARLSVAEGEVQNVSEQHTAQAIFYTASRATKTLRPFSKNIIITSPMYEGDFGMKLLCMAGTIKAGKHKNYLETLRSKYPKKLKRMIGYYFTTLEANGKSEDNPTGYTEEDFETERTENITAYLRDYEALPPAAIHPWIEYPERIENCVNIGAIPPVLFEDVAITERVGNEVRNYIGKVCFVSASNRLRKYFISCDQGEVKDSFVVSMGHAEEREFEGRDPSGQATRTIKQKIVVDFIEEWKPDKEQHITVSFQNVEEIIELLCRNFYVALVTYDQWNSTESIQRLFSKGIITEKLGADLKMYETLKLLIYSNMAEFPENPKLIQELRQLNLIKGVKIDHPYGMGKDLADSVCRVANCVYNDSIRDAVQGKHILPVAGKYNTSPFLSGLNDLSNGGFDPGYGMGNGSSIFGKHATYVKRNVISNIFSQVKK